MKKLNKKGFTIVELVIVIAVIGILAAVLIPTFSGIVEKANESAALQEATNTYKALLTEDDYDGNLDLNPTADEADVYIVAKGMVFKVVDGEITLTDMTSSDDIEKEETGTAGNPYYKALEGNYTDVYVYVDEQTATETTDGSGT